MKIELLLIGFGVLIIGLLEIVLNKKSAKNPLIWRKYLLMDIPYLKEAKGWRRIGKITLAAGIVLIILGILL